LKILHFTDSHFSYYPPESRVDNYLESCLRKMDEIKKLAKKHDCSFITFSGDWFHLKSWIKNPYILTNKLIDCFQSIHIPIYGIIGDHDSLGKIEDAEERQPITTLAKATDIRLLSKGDVEDLGEGVYLTGCPKIGEYESDLTNYMPKRPDKAKVHISLSHGDLYKQPPVYSPVTLYSQLAGSTVDYLFNGHVHLDMGIETIGTCHIINRGSLTRGSLTNDNIKRTIKVVVLDTTSGKIDTIELKSPLPIEKIFDLEKHDKAVQAENEIDKLAQLIKQESGEIEINSLDGIKQLIKELKNVDPEVKYMCESLLDKSEALI